ncbi:REP-associated tyrosine transposase [Stenotrophomonas mori]|uniref:Transposase n=1 Tax=Stenotrophomonas mori TaxID=2871096 RepID=A0ABT0SI22_9GAMM|nr:transposase [Stenotrophomonas mori]MCL7714991.1 transposase [Stenotrophomonas mori]
MASPKLLLGRVSRVGYVYSVTTVTARRHPWFLDDAHVHALLEALRTSDRLKRTLTLAWVVMPDHLHWLFQLRQGTLSACLRDMKAGSARRIHRLRRTRGRLWQPGYHDHAVRHHESLHALVTYLMQNPVRAGLCRHADDYPHAWRRWPTH